MAMTKKVSYFIHLQEKTHTHSMPYLAPLTVFKPVTIFFCSCSAQVSRLVLTEWAAIMTVRSYGSTRRHMSVLCSSNAQPKLLLCVNKDDRKWQFGSSNHECHSQLRPLPTPDTFMAEEVTGLTPLSLCPSLFPFLPFFHLFYRT